MNPQEQPTSSVQPTPTPDVNTPQPSSEPPKSKNTMLIVAAIIAVVLVLGGIAFAMIGMNNDSKNTNNTSNQNSSNENTPPASSNYQKYDVTDKSNGVTFSVSFYKDAKVEEKNGRTYLNSGETGSMYSFYLGVATGDKIDCGKSPTTTMNLGGESTTVCYQADNTQYAGYAKTKNGAVKINLAGQKAISMDEAKTIMESAKFN